MRWTSPSASFLTVTRRRPVAETRSIALFARVFPAAK